MGIVVEQREESSAISLAGTVDISAAAELKRALLECLDRGRPVRLSIGSDADLDVTALQLLWAVEREARARQVEFTLDGRLPDSVGAALKDAGFEGFPFLF
jgi:anti-anti-sigma regulatory factor